MDRYAASRATVVAAGVVVLLLVAQTAVGAAFTAGKQPMAVSQEVPTNPSAAAWSDAPSKTLGMSAQKMATPYGGGSVDELQLQAITNETHVAFRLTWTDPTNDTALSAPHAYSDAVAIMFHDGSQPPITMGGAGAPVNIWYWRANWEYGNHSGNGDWTGDMYAYPHPDEQTKPGLAANNPLSKNEFRRYAHNYYAKGFGTLSHATAQNVDGQAVRDGDEWQVTFVRERATDGEFDTPLDGSSKVYLTVAAWNGSAGDVNGEKSLSYQFLTLDTNSGELAAVDSTGGSSGSSSGSDVAGESSGSTSGGVPTSGLPTDFWTGLGTLLAVTLVSWMVAYRSLKGEGR